MPSSCVVDGQFCGWAVKHISYSILLPLATIATSSIRDSDIISVLLVTAVKRNLITHKWNVVALDIRINLTNPMN